MTDRQDDQPASDPLRFPDGRPKSSPDDTSLLGLAAVWSELDAPMPPKRSEARGGSHQRPSRRARRRSRRHRAGRPVLLVLGVAIVLALAVIVVLVTQLT